jgi:two-component system CheB/CheR fusion protein
VHIAEQASHFLRLAGGEPTRDLVSLVAPAWRPALRTALFQARKSGRETSTGAVNYEERDSKRAIDMAVLPFFDEHYEGLLMLVSFKRTDATPATDPPAGEREHLLLEQFEQELRHTRNKLLDTMDQAEQSDAALRTSVEELQTSVEELRSANSERDALLAKAHADNDALRAAHADLSRRLDNLGKSHDDLNNLIASSDVATLFLDREMRILRYTPRIADLFNVIPADVGRPLLHITSRLHNARLAEDAARVFETLQPLEQEVISKDGRAYIVRVHPYRTGTHRIEGAVMTFFDITRHKAAQDALRESEVLMRTLLESHAQAIWQTDAQGRVVADSPSWLAYTGQTGMEWSGDGWADALHPDDRAMALDVWRSGIDAVRVIRNRFRLHVANGGWRWTSVLAAPVRDTDGSVRKWVGMNIDIDAEKRAEQAFSRLFDASPAPFLVLGTDAPRFTIREVNSAYLAATMRTREELVGRGIFEAYPGNPAGTGAASVEILRASLEHVLATRRSESLPDLKCDIARPDGSFEERWWRTINSPVLDEDGAVEAILHHVNDVTTACRANAALRDGRRA